MSVHSCRLAVLSLAFVACTRQVPQLPPDPPTDVAAAAGIRQATVQWTAPAQEALGPITYTAIASPGGATASTGAHQVLVTGLSNGTAYTFTVTARSSAGESGPSAPSAPITTPDVPGAPAVVVAVAGDGQAQVSWTAGPDHGSAVTAFTVTALPGGATATSPASPATVTGLTNGTTYTFKVAATNAVGAGPWSEPSAPIAPAPAAFDTSPVAVGPTASALDPSWSWGPMMQVFVRAYRDSNGDGEGDLAGLIEKLDYLQELGIRGILLMPVNRNQDRDHGYFTTSYREVAPDYGSLQDLDRLVAQAHARGMGIILDEVFDYTGTQHPGFASALADPGSAWRDWFVWSPADPGWGGWWWETPTGWYYAVFGPQSPQLNWRSPAVRAYQQDTLRFWLNRGVDGFRIDAASMLVGNGPTAMADQPETLQAVVELRQVVDRYQDRLLLCEAPGNPAAYGGSDVCGSGFLFSLVAEQRGDGTWVTCQAAVLAAAQREGSASALWQLAYRPMYAPIGSMGTLLANHDRFAGKRLWDQFGGDTPAYRLAASTLLLMPGAPFLYYGEEIGMAETLLPTAWPDSDHHQRGVMSWTGDPANAGFSASTSLDGPLAVDNPDDKYLRPVPNASDHNMEAERGDPTSLLEHYRSLIALRKAHHALARGLYQPVAVDASAWVFERSHGDEDLLVAVNYGVAEAPLGLTARAPGTYQVLYAYGADAAPLEVAEDGSALVVMPPQSLVVYRQAWEAGPLGELYVRGSHNDWGAPPEARLPYLGGNRYQGSVPLPAGTVIFKLSTSDWDWRVNLGVMGGGQLQLGQDRVVDQTWWRDTGAGSDLSLEVPEAGLYQFTLTADDPYRPVLTVTPAAGVTRGPAPSVSPVGGSGAARRGRDPGPDLLHRRDGPSGATDHAMSARRQTPDEPTWYRASHGR